MCPPSSIRKVSYRNQRWPSLGIETLWFSDLRDRVPQGYFTRPERRDFHILMLCTAGTGLHHVDFSRIELHRGVVLHVHPGQVLQHSFEGDMGARLALFLPEFLGPEGHSADAPSPLSLEEPEFQALERAFAELQEEYEQTDGSPLSMGLLQHLLEAFLLRMNRVARFEGASPRGNPSQMELLRLFRRELEASFRQSREVAHYARRLGYSARTLDRAAMALEDLSAKALIDGRVVLEAKRLLVHTQEPVGTIARHLGFSEATNFAKFFRKGAGCSPTAFRDRMVG